MSYKVDKIVSVRELKHSSVSADKLLSRYFSYALHDLMKVVQTANYNFDSIIITVTAVNANESRAQHSHRRVQEQPRTITTIEEAK